MSLVRIRATALAATALALIAGPALADSYRVKFAKGREDDDGLYRRAEVEARITPRKGGEFGLIRNWGDPGFHNGWTTFVQTLAVTDGAGAVLEAKPGDGGRWTLPGWTGGEVTVRYAMLLQHDRFPSRIGDGEAAYARPYGVSWTGRALLVEGASARDIAVAFDLPEGWIATTPWRRTSPVAWTFVARDTDDLLDSAFIAGRHRESIIPLGGFEARLAVSPKAADTEPVFRGSFETYLGAYGRLFGVRSNTDAPLVIAVDAGYWAAGVMGRSINMLMGGELDENTRPLLDYVIAHEGFHLWNVSWFASGDDPERWRLEWLGEGAAEYYTWRVGLRSGRVSEAAFLAELGRRHDLYRSRLAGGSIAEAGRIKGGSPETYDRVYTGGMVTLLALDLMIRRETRNRASLDELVREIHRRHATDGGPGVSEAELKSLLAAYGIDGEGFFRRHLHGREPLPVAALLDGAGLELNTTPGAEGPATTVRRKRSPTAAQRRAAEAYLRAA